MIALSLPMRLIKSLCLISGIFATLNLMAATEGASDDTSTGTVSISLSVLPSLQIQNVDNIRFNITDRKIDAYYEQSFCVMGSKFGKYTVTALGSDQDLDNFLLRNDKNQELPYSVGYRGDTQRGEFDPLAPGTPSPVYDVIPYNENCGDSVSFQITFRSEHLLRVKSGLYTGHLTLTVSPL